MPETALVAALIKGAQAREAEMVAASAARVGDNAGKSGRRCAPRRCTARAATSTNARTQTVFGEGPLDARIVFVGEQPGDQEDLAGRPFVGPAGQLFDRALAEAGIDRKRTYVTNAVKHFKFVRRGKRRIHDKPNAGEITACRWWLQQELALIRPPLTVALGATAARALFGKVVTISALRGKGHTLPEGGEAWVTVHPSFLLRVRDDREAEYARFVEDLARIGERAKALASRLHSTVGSKAAARFHIGRRRFAYGRNRPHLGARRDDHVRAATDERDFVQGDRAGVHRRHFEAFPDSGPGSRQQPSKIRLLEADPEPAAIGSGLACRTRHRDVGRRGVSDISLIVGRRLDRRPAAPARRRQPAAFQSRTSILPILPPLNRSRKACGAASRPSWTVSREVTFPAAIQPPMSR